MQAWREVDTDALGANTRAIRGHLGATRLMAVVKADAYGLWISRIVPILEANGAEAFAVVTLEEAREVRRVSDRDVLIMSYLEPDEIEAAAQEGFILSLFDPALEGAYRRAGARVHLKVETGMNRLGVPLEAALRILENPEGVEAVMSHLAMSDQEAPREKQKACFEPVIARARELGLAVHLTNSHGLSTFQSGFYDWVRVGIALYGAEPLVPGLAPVLSVRARVAQVKTVQKGEGVSYNHRYVAPETHPVGIVAIGYADGYTQAMTGHAHVLIQGQKRKVLGQICMNLIVVDATGLELERGEVVTLLGRDGAEEITVEDLCRWTGLRHHEIILSFGKMLSERT